MDIRRDPFGKEPEKIVGTWLDVFDGEIAYLVRKEGGFREISSFGEYLARGVGEKWREDLKI